MRTKRKLLPGAPGTKKMVAKYGERLICIRYRYDAQRRKKIKTVELIEDEHDWHPDERRIPANKVVKVKIAYGEIELGKLMRRVGGRWNRQEKAWEVPYFQAVNLGLQDRIVEDKDV